MKLSRLMAVVMLGSGIAASTVLAADADDELQALTAEIKAMTEIVDKCPGSLKDIVPCMKRLSTAGNRFATYILAELHADPDGQGEPSGVKRDKGESLRFALLANKQGSIKSLGFVPPRPYQAAIGMSDVQVKASERGAPDKIAVKEGGKSVQKWQYRDATLEFEPSPVSRKHWILKSIR